MVRMTENGFMIEVPTVGNPADDYLETVNQLIELLQYRDPENPVDNYLVLGLLRHMMPDLPQAKRMFAK